MKKSEKIVTVIQLVLLAVVVFAAIFAHHLPNIARDLILVVSICILAAITYSIFKTKKINRQVSSLVIKNIIIVLVAALIICFNLGLLLGFSRTFFPISWQKLFEGIIPIIALAVGMEVLRASTYNATNGNKVLLASLAILFAVVEVVTETNADSFGSIEAVFITLCTVIMPAIASQMLLTFLNVKAGIKSALVYSLAIKLYLYILPIVPDLGDYIYSVLWLIIPYSIYHFSKMSLADSAEYNSRRERRITSKYRKIRISIISIPVLALLTTLTVLVSGIFRYKMIAIASGSMEPTFVRGDAVIYDKDADLVEGDVIALMKDNSVIAHRVVAVESQSDGSEIYKTKGDANPIADDFETSRSSVLGKVKYIIKYIGYPTVWFNEMLGNI